MKKIKLLMPILGLTAIASSAIPVTSCKANKSLVAISVKDVPVKEFNIGDRFSSIGLTLTATYGDGTTKDITSGYSTDYDNKVFASNDIGDQIVTVTYTEGDISKTALYAITVKSVVDITKEQWNNVFKAIKDPTDTTRDFTIEGVLEVHNPGQGGMTEMFDVKCKGDKNEGTWMANEKYNSMFKQDSIFWIADENAKITPNIGKTQEDLVNVVNSFYVFGQLFDSLYDYITYKGNLVYQVRIDNIFDTFNLYFNFVLEKDGDQYRVTNVLADLDMIYESQSINFANAYLKFYNYGKTTLSTDFDTQFADLDNRIVTATLDGSKYVVEAKKQYSLDQFNFFMPNDLSLANLNTINVVAGDGMSTIYLRLNDEDLEKDTDYTVTYESEKATKITLKTPLKANDKLMLFSSPLSTTDKLKLELVEVA